MSGLERSVANLCGAALAAHKTFFARRLCGGRERGARCACPRIFTEKDRIEQICVRDGRITFLVFREEKLRSHLEKAENVSFLARYGYPVSDRTREDIFSVKSQNCPARTETIIYSAYSIK